ncbi:hypothetical protein chiPu_0026066 [Chiloscyllium punctatum]|uniref:Uncharacterized protein n=1 Tax=Chiloscyllium punctatum TaxID=137246 RepID=A0A401THN1_CHIPU|nr:hypothetical protein [Chiloscyllium punctatum]
MWPHALSRGSFPREKRQPLPQGHMGNGVPDAKCRHMTMSNVPEKLQNPQCSEPPGATKLPRLPLSLNQVSK